MQAPGEIPPQAPLPDFHPYFARVNIFEYKSSHDKPQSHDLAKVMGYLGLYCDQNKIDLDAISGDYATWYVTARRPRFFDRLKASGAIRPEGAQGLYEWRRPFPCKYFLVVVNELEVTKSNLPFLLLASGGTLRDAIRMLASDASVAATPSLKGYLSWIYLNHYTELKDMVELKSVRENIMAWIDDTGGLKAVIMKVGLEAVVKAVGLDKVKAILAKIEEEQ